MGGRGDVAYVEARLTEFMRGTHAAVRNIGGGGEVSVRLCV